MSQCECCHTSLEKAVNNQWKPFTSFLFCCHSLSSEAKKIYQNASCCNCFHLAHNLFFIQFVYKSHRGRGCDELVSMFAGSLAARAPNTFFPPWREEKWEHGTVRLPPVQTNITFSSLYILTWKGRRCCRRINPPLDSWHFSHRLERRLDGTQSMGEAWSRIKS